MIDMSKFMKVVAKLELAQASYPRESARNGSPVSLRGHRRVGGNHAAP